MKIEIDIDIESIVIEAIKKKEASNTYVPPIEVTIPTPTETSTPSRSKWEYGRKNGRRRSPEEMALHDEERRLGRRLTPEEKGEIKAKFQLDDTAETKAKEALLRKDRIEKLAAEGLAAASKEVEQEEQVHTDSTNTNIAPEREESNSEPPNSLFTS